MDRDREHFFQLQLHCVEKFLLYNFEKSFKECVLDPGQEWARREAPLPKIFEVKLPTGNLCFSSAQTCAQNHLPLPYCKGPLLTCLASSLTNSEQQMPPTELALRLGDNPVLTLVAEHPFRVRLDILEFFLAHAYKGEFEQFVVCTLLIFWKCCGVRVSRELFLEKLMPEFKLKLHQWRHERLLGPMTTVCVENFKSYSRLDRIRAFLEKKFGKLKTHKLKSIVPGKNFEKAVVNQELYLACRRNSYCEDWLRSVDSSCVPSRAGLGPTPIPKKKLVSRAHVISTSPQNIRRSSGDLAPSTAGSSEEARSFAFCEYWRRVLCKACDSWMEAGILERHQQNDWCKAKKVAAENRRREKEAAGGFNTTQPLAAPGTGEESDVSASSATVSSVTTAEKSLEPPNDTLTTAEELEAVKNVLASSRKAPDAGKDATISSSETAASVLQLKATPSTNLGKGAAAASTLGTNQLSDQGTSSSASVKTAHNQDKRNVKQCKIAAHVESASPLLENEEKDDVPQPLVNGRREGKGSENAAAVCKAKICAGAYPPPQFPSESASSNAASVPVAGYSGSSAAKSPTLPMDAEALVKGKEQVPFLQDNQDELSDEPPAFPTPLDAGTASSASVPAATPHGDSLSPPDAFPVPVPPVQGSSKGLASSDTPAVRNLRRSGRKNAVHYCSTCEASFGSVEKLELHRVTHKRGRLSGSRERSTGLKFSGSGKAEPGSSHGTSPCLLADRKPKFKTPHSQCGICGKFVSTTYLPVHQQRGGCKPKQKSAFDKEQETLARDIGKLFKNKRFQCPRCQKEVSMLELNRHQELFLEARRSEREASEKGRGSKSAADEDERMPKCVFTDCFWKHFRGTRAQSEEHMGIHHFWHCYGLQCPDSDCELQFCWEKHLKKHLEEPEFRFWDISGPEQMNEFLFGDEGRKYNEKRRAWLASQKQAK